MTQKNQKVILENSLGPQLKKYDTVTKKRKFINHELIPFIENSLEENKVRIVNITDSNLRGYCYTETNDIYLDAKIQLLVIFIHEVIHLIYPDMKENDVCYLEQVVCPVLTHKQSRKIIKLMAKKMID